MFSKSGINYEKREDCEPKVHELKISPKYYKEVCHGRKSFEIRKNDRNFAIGDELVLKEWSPSEGYTGYECNCTVTYILNDEKYLQSGYVCLAIRVASYIGRPGL